MDKKHTIMIVEDDPAIRFTLQLFFESEGYQVLAAENGQEALEIFNRSPHVCVIFLDLFMPVMDGAEFLERIRREVKAVISGIPVVVLSAAPPEGSMATRIKSQANQFVKKPASLDKLIQLTREYCNAVLCME